MERAGYLVPEEDRSNPRKRRVITAHGAFLYALFDLNDWMIDRWGGDLPEVYDTTEFPWIADLEAAWGDIRAELDAYVAQDRSIPHVAEVAGLRVGSVDAMNSAPVDQGEWKALILAANGEWIPETSRHFPRTMAAVASCPQFTTIGFSALEPHSHIASHVGSNRGALRYQLPIIVPGEPGQCRIRLGEEMVVWQEGRSVLFDLKVNHEAWNDADRRRVLFMIETAMPLPQPMATVNRLVQRQFRHFPSFRAMPDRVRRLARDDAAAASPSPQP